MLARKSQGTGAVLAYRGQLLTENRNGLVISTLTTRAYDSATSRTGESWLDVHLHSGGLQLGTHPQPDARCR
jgi:hypothetical protein